MFVIILFKNQGNGRFNRVTGEEEPFGREVEVSRGLAFGDLDGDGDLDMVVSNNDLSVRLFRNETRTANRRWLAVRAMNGPVTSLGARIELSGSGVRRVGMLLASYGYLSSHQPLAHFGLGDWIPGSVVVTWMDGSRERFPVEGMNRILTVTKGEGVPL